MLRLREYWSLVVRSITAWNDDYAPSMGAAQIFLPGAAFTWVYAQSHGSKAKA
jgi:hypothetical protein